MNLTVKSLNKAKECCQEYLKLESVLEQENQLALISDLKTTLRNIDQTLSLTDQIMNFKASLESVGYSDEWFDTVSSNGRIGGVVDIEVPKFFDNPTNRGKACMEGMIESIKNFIVRICDFIMNVIRKVLAFFNITVSFLSNEDTIEEKIKQGADAFRRKVGEAELKKWMMEHPFKVEKWYISDKIVERLNNTMSLLDIVVPGTDFNGIRSGILDANSYGGRDTQAIRAEYYQKLVQSLHQVNIPVNDPDCGFVPINDTSTPSMVMFAGTDIKDVEFESMELAIGSWRDFEKIVMEETRDIQAASKAVVAAHVRMKKAISKRAAETEGIKNAMKKIDTDPDRTQFYLCEATITSCSLNILVSAQNFLNYIGRIRRTNNLARKKILEVLTASEAEMKS